MYKKKLLILVEGDRDKRFFEKIIKPRLADRYRAIAIQQTSQSAPPKVSAIIKGYIANNDDVIIVSDKDSSICLTKKRQEIQKKFDLSDYRTVMIVDKKIEFWYSAGLTADAAARLELEAWETGKILDKRDFDKNRPRRFDSEIDFREEVLKHFSVEAALDVSDSFQYFMKKYGLLE